MKLLSWLLIAAFLTACCATLSGHDDDDAIKHNKSSILRQPIEKVNPNKRTNVLGLNTLPIKSPTMVDHALEAEESQPLAIVGFITKNGNIYELADDTNTEERQSRSSNAEVENENEQPHICNYGSIVIYSDLPCEQVYTSVGQQQTAAEENTNTEETQLEENVYNENRRRSSIKRSRRKRKQKRRYKNGAKRPLKSNRYKNRPSKKRKKGPTNFELNEFNRPYQQRPTKGNKMKNGYRRPQKSNKKGNSNRNKNKFSLIKLQNDDDYYYDDDYEYEDEYDNDDFENFFRNQRPNQRKRPLKMYANNYHDY